MIFFWKHGTRYEYAPDGLYYKNFTYPKTAAIINKIAIIFPANVIENSTGFYQIN